MEIAATASGTRLRKGGGEIVGLHAACSTRTTFTLSDPHTMDALRKDTSSEDQEEMEEKEELGIQRFPREDQEGRMDSHRGRGH